MTDLKDPTEIRLVIPEEQHGIIRFKQEDLSGVAVVNPALIPFEPKSVFRWHLSVMIHLDDVVESGMPSEAETEVIDPFGDELDRGVKGADPARPNALFLARITWNGTRELVYRAFDPELADAYLRKLIGSAGHPRPLDYRIDDDPNWELADWHLRSAAQCT